MVMAGELPEIGVMRRLVYTFISFIRWFNGPRIWEKQESDFAQIPFRAIYHQLFAHTRFELPS